MHPAHAATAPCPPLLAQRTRIHTRVGKRGHVHFHVCVVDGVFEEVAGDTDAQSSPPGIVFRLASGIDEITVAQVQADLRRRILEVFPLLCPMCGGQMRLIAFITDGTQIRKILDHSGVDSEPPHISPARGPPLWDDCDTQTDEGVHIEPDWDLAAQRAPDFEVDQRVK